MVSMFSFTKTKSIVQIAIALTFIVLYSQSNAFTHAVYAKAKNPVDAAQELYKKKQYKNARDILSDYLKLYPKHYRALYIRARCYQKLAMDRLAVKDLTKLIDMKHKELKYRLIRGEINVEYGHAEEAIKDLEFVLKSQPNSFYLWDQLALAYRITKNRDKAIECYTKMIAINPKVEKAYNMRGRMYQSKNDYKNAIKDYTSSIALNNRKTNPFVFRGLCYFDLKENAKAEADFTRAIKLGHRSVDPLLMRAKVYDRLGKKKLAAKDRKAARVDDFEIPYHGRKSVK